MAANIFKIDMDKVNCKPREINTFLDIVNGIAVFLYDEGYEEGCRNNVMVDLVCALGILGFPWDEVIQTMDCLCFFMGDDEDPLDRAERIAGYDKQFSWGWMIDPSSWIDIWAETPRDKREEMPIKFER